MKKADLGPLGEDRMRQIEAFLTNPNLRVSSASGAAMVNGMAKELFRELRSLEAIVLTWKREKEEIEL